MSIGSLPTIVNDKYDGNYQAWLKDFVVRVKKAYPNAVKIGKQPHCIQSGITRIKETVYKDRF